MSKKKMYSVRLNRELVAEADKARRPTETRTALIERLLRNWIRLPDYLRYPSAK